MEENERIRGQSVAEIAYARLRQQITSGGFPPNARLNQGDLATTYGISRTSLREALHRLASENLVEFSRHRGFFVAGPLPLGEVLNRLEVRLLLEPGIARLAAERATPEDVKHLRASLRGEAKEGTPKDAHDLSREFHVGLARAAANDDLVRILDSLWTVEVGRQLLAVRDMTPGWKAKDVKEHRAIADAVANGDGERAGALMQQHIADALEHWSQRAGVELAEGAGG